MYATMLYQREPAHTYHNIFVNDSYMTVCISTGSMECASPINVSSKWHTFYTHTNSVYTACGNILKLYYRNLAYSVEYISEPYGGVVEGRGQLTVWDLLFSHNFKAKSTCQTEKLNFPGCILSPGGVPGEVTISLFIFI